MSGEKGNLSELRNSDISQERMWGVVVKYNKERGFGFIRSKVDGRDYFVHISQVQNGIGILERGYIVEFSIGINRRSEREEAESVIIIDTQIHRKKDHDNGTQNCAECNFMKNYNYDKKIYYCDHEARIDDMGKLGVDHLPEISPEWCPLRNN